MTESMGIELRDYEESLAEDIAAMWNTWDELWPGGFTQGVPYTAERVHKQYGKSNALAILIAINTENNKPVGSCTLYAHWRDTEAAYIGELGVSPEALGKKVGKRLLLESLERASKQGYMRVDLNTWAGNMKAVPLYKKIGMMWNPEISGVHMEDYVPGILQHPLCLPFFVPLSGNQDWYDVHVRVPTQAPDDFEVNGLAVYPYEFKIDDNSLSIVVDRYGRGISSIDRTIDGSRLKVYAKVDSHQVLCGLPYTYTLEIDNETESEIEVSASLSAFDGLEFDDEASLSKKIPAGEKYEWTVSYHLTSSAPLFRDNIKASTIITQLEIDGQKSELVTGIKVKPAAEIKTRWGISRIKSGGTTSIPLTVVSYLAKKSMASIHLDSENPLLTLELEDEKIKLTADGFGGTVLNVKADSALRPGAHDIWVSLEIEDGLVIQTRKFRIPIFCLGDHDIAIGHDDLGRRLVIASPTYTANISIEGAILNANDDFNPSSSGYEIRSAIGPPFGLSPFRFAEREHSVQSADNETVVSMNATHPTRPLDIEERTTFEHGTEVIVHEVWITNTSTESETFQLRLYGRGGGISFSQGQFYVPLATGIMKEKLGNFYANHPAIPGEPSTFSEGWIANEQNGLTYGQLWDNSKVEEVRLGHGQMGMITYPMVTLEAGETRRISQLWLIFGAKSWTHVQRIWRSRVAGYFENRVDSFRTAIPQRLVNLDVEPIIIPHLQDVESSLRLSKSMIVPLKGSLQYSAPKGWSASITPTDISLDNSKEGSMASGDILLTHDTSFGLKLSPGPKVSDKFGIHRGLARFSSDWNMTKSTTMVQLGASDGSVEVLEDVDQGLKVFTVDNGLIEYTVSADFGGCLISLKNDKGIEFLDNSFPTPAPKPGGFFEHYYGGVQPFVFDEELGEDLDKARTNKEKMSGKVIESGYWKGVEVSWVGKLQKLARGVDFKLRYLTTPKSPLVLIQWTIKNKTSAPLKFWPTFFVDPDLTKELAGGSFETDWDGDSIEVRKGMIPVGVVPTKNYVWMRPRHGIKKTSGFGFLMAGLDSRLLTVNLGEVMILGGVDGMTWLMPGDDKVITAGLLVDPQSIDDLRDLQEVLDKL